MHGRVDGIVRKYGGISITEHLASRADQGGEISEQHTEQMPASSMNDAI
jgi:hypothetical protein